MKECLLLVAVVLAACSSQGKEAPSASPGSPAPYRTVQPVEAAPLIGQFAAPEDPVSVQENGTLALLGRCVVFESSGRPLRVALFPYGYGVRYQDIRGWVVIDDEGKVAAALGEHSNFAAASHTPGSVLQGGCENVGHGQVGLFAAYPFIRQGWRETRLDTSPTRTVVRTPSGDLYIEMPAEARVSVIPGAAGVRARANLPDGTWVVIRDTLQGPARDDISSVSAGQVRDGWIGATVTNPSCFRSDTEQGSGFYVRFTVVPHPGHRPRSPSVVPPGAVQPQALLDMTGPDFENVRPGVISTGGKRGMVVAERYSWPPGVCDQVNTT